MERQPDGDRESCWRTLARWDVGAAVRAWFRREPVLACGLALTALLGYGYAHTWPVINGSLNEWYWRYRPQLDLLPFVARATAWLLPGAAVAGAAWWWIRRRSRPLRRRLGLMLLLAWGIYFHWAGWSTLHDLSPSLLGGTMLDPSATGFTGVALRIQRGELPPLGELLRHYPESMRTFSHHAMTHPPGWVVMSAGALRLTNHHPDLARGLERLMVHAGVDFGWYSLAPLSTPDRVAAMLLGLGMVLAGLLTALPLFGLIRSAGGGERTAWAAACLWIHHPSLIVFTPSFDQFHALIVLMGLWAWRRGLNGRPAVWGTAVGLASALGLFLSFKLLLWLPLAGLLALLEIRRRTGTVDPRAVRALLGRGPVELQRLFILMPAAALTVLVVCLALWLLAGVNLWEIFLAACRNQVVLTRSLTRTYGTWLVYGPLDVLALSGPALSVTAIAGWGRALAGGWRMPERLEPALAIFPLGLIVVTLSGLILGENARQLLMFGPGMAWGAATWLSHPGTRNRTTNLALLLMAQFIFTAVCLNAMEFITH